jgi:predicted nucleotidyltransferase
MQPQDTNIIDDPLRKVLSGSPQNTLAISFGPVASGKAHPQSDLDLAKNNSYSKLMFEGKSSTVEPAITKNYIQQLRKRVVSHQKPQQ